MHQFKEREAVSLDRIIREPGGTPCTTILCLTNFVPLTRVSTRDMMFRLIIRQVGAYEGERHGPKKTELIGAHASVVV
jgi:hypothetical protein